MIDVFVTRDEHVELIDGINEAYVETGLWQVREGVSGGSELIDCCLTREADEKLAHDVRKE